MTSTGGTSSTAYGFTGETMDANGLVYLLLFKRRGSFPFAGYVGRGYKILGIFGRCFFPSGYFPFRRLGETMKKLSWLLSVFILLQGCASSPTPPPISGRTNQELIQELKRYEYSSTETPEYSFQEVLDELSKRGSSASEAAPMLAKMIAFDGSASVTASKPLVAMGASAKPAIPYLLQNLSNPREDVKRYSIFVLGIIGPTASCAVPQIADFLWDDDAYVRSATAGALTGITQLELVEYDFYKLDPEEIGSVFGDEPEGYITNIARDWWINTGQNQEWSNPDCEMPEQ